MKKDIDYIVRLEKAIKEKYGVEAIQNPAKFWNEEKEKQYLQQLSEHVDKVRRLEGDETFDNVGGILISRKLLNKETILTCPTCARKLKTVRDDIYILKFECCERCFIKHVEGREERWQSGWRPEECQAKQKK